MMSNTSIGARSICVFAIELLMQIIVSETSSLERQVEEVVSLRSDGYFRTSDPGKPDAPNVRITTQS